MKKFITLAVVAMALITVSSTLVLAEDKVAAEDKVDHEAMLAEMEGIDIYRNVCKSCHGPDADAGEYTPMDLIMEQWDEFFQDSFAETHKDVACPKDESTLLTDIFSKDIIKKVQKFCVDHAADSEQPMTCG